MFSNQMASRDITLSQMSGWISLGQGRQPRSPNKPPEGQAEREWENNYFNFLLLLLYLSNYDVYFNQKLEFCINFPEFMASLDK